MTETGRKTAAPQPRLADISLNQGNSPLTRPEVEMERHKTLSDLLSDNNFSIQGAPGPYRLSLGIAEERLLMDIACKTTDYQENIRLSLKPLKHLVHDYAILVESFYKTAKAGDIHRLESLDEGRRALHDEGAETLLELLENKVTLDKGTARRLFSLVYVLHIRTLT
jgi:uncharacterized protein (UPF0262 family)